MRRLHRCRWDKKIAGICGGLGQYFKCDPTLIRLFLVILFFLTGLAPIAIGYIIAWIVLPLGPKVYVEIPGKKLYRSKANRKISGVCGGLGEYFNIDPTLIRVIFVIGGIFTAVAPIFISYLIGMAIIPDNPDQQKYR